MAQSRTTFGKRQRERDKQAKQQAKQEKRQARASDRDRDEPTSPSVSPAEEARALNALAHLQERFGAGELTIEQFEEARDELRKSLTID